MTVDYSNRKWGRRSISAAAMAGAAMTVLTGCGGGRSISVPVSTPSPSPTPSGGPNFGAEWVYAVTGTIGSGSTATSVTGSLVAAIVPTDRKSVV